VEQHTWLWDIKKKNVLSDMIDAWEDTHHLVFIEECSFASFELFQKMIEMRGVRNNGILGFFGKLNIDGVYAGDIHSLSLWPPHQEAVQW
jgi:hypothetical protein